MSRTRSWGRGRRGRPARAQAACAPRGAAAQLVVRGRVVFEQRLGEPQRAERRAHDLQQIGAVHVHELHAAAADVHDQRRLRGESQRRLHREVDETAFLLARDDARRDARRRGARACRNSPPFFASRTAAVAVHGMRSDGVPARQLDEARAARRRVRCMASRPQPAVVERAASDLHDLALAVQHAERVGVRGFTRSPCGWSSCRCRWRRCARAGSLRCPVYRPDGPAGQSPGATRARRTRSPRG